MFNRILACNLEKPDIFYSFGLTAHPYCGESAAESGLYGCYFKPTDKDSRYLFIFRNSDPLNAAVVTLLAGDGPLAAGRDVSFSIAAGCDAIIQVESGRFMFVSQHDELAAHVGTLDTNGCIFFTTGGDKVSASAVHSAL